MRLEIRSVPGYICWHFFIILFCADNKNRNLIIRGKKIKNKLNEQSREKEESKENNVLE